MHFCFVFGLEPWLLPPAIEMAEALKAKGHQVKVIYAQYLGSQPDEKDYDTTNTYKIIPKQTGYKRFIIHRYIRKAVKKMLAANNADVVMACDIISLQAIAGINGVKKGYWGFEIVEPPKQLKASLYMYRASAFPGWVSKLDFFLAPSQSRVDKIATRCGKKVPNTVIYNCRRLENDNRNTPARSPYTLIYTGRLSATQYIEEIIDAMELLDSNIILYIAGPSSEEYSKQLHNKIATNQLLKKRVFIKGRLSREEVYALTATADIGFVFYNSEMSDEANDPAPNKLSDYIAAQIWSIGSGQPYIKYWLEERGAGICIEQVTKNSIAGAVNKILSDDNFTNRQVLADIYHKELNMGAQADKLLTLLQKL